VAVSGRDAMPTGVWQGAVILKCLTKTVSSNSYFLISALTSAMPSLSCNAAVGIYLIALESKFRIPKSRTRPLKYGDVS